MQILTGFLLTIPFTGPFADLPSSRHVVYGIVLCLAVTATFLLMTPVALHRALFHRGERPWLVEAADTFARWGLGALAVAIIGAVWFIFDVIWSPWLASAIAAVILAFVGVVWVLIPARERRMGS